MKKGALSILLFVALLGCKKETPQTIPVITTTSVNSITANSVNSGGSITNNGGSEITDKGIFWSKNPNPTENDNKISNGKGAESFTSNITGLVGGTKYYIRAYAVNTTGIGYGNEVSFTTSSTLATLGQFTTVNATDTSLKFSLILQSNGGATITEIGVCYASTDNPTINDKKVIATSSSSNSFDALITKLPNDTKYFVRPYATNSVGTIYGTSVSLSTLPQRVVDIDGNSYKTVRIGNQIWMAENLRVTKFNNGDNIAYTPAASLNSPLVEYVWVKNDTVNKILLGALYSDGVVMSNKLVAPKGYHIPSVAEFNTLISSLGGEANAAAAIKSGTQFYFNGVTYGWVAYPTHNVTNSSGFSLLPAGYYSWSGKNFGISDAYLWTSDAKNIFQIPNMQNKINLTIWNPTSIYFSIRCVKD